MTFDRSSIDPSYSMYHIGLFFTTKVTMASRRRASPASSSSSPTSGAASFVSLSSSCCYSLVVHLLFLVLLTVSISKNTTAVAFMEHDRLCGLLSVEDYLLNGNVTDDNDDNDDFVDLGQVDAETAAWHAITTIIQQGGLYERLTKIYNTKAKTHECRTKIAQHLGYYMAALGQEELLPFSNIQFNNTARGWMVVSFDKMLAWLVFSITG
jgi:hypothetical protein